MILDHPLIDTDESTEWISRRDDEIFEDYRDGNPDRIPGKRLARRVSEFLGLPRFDAPAVGGDAAAR